MVSDTWLQVLTASVEVNFSVAGLHHWPGAAEQRAYLANPHRHLFEVRVTCDVGHDEREVEFHDLLEDARRAFSGLGAPYHPRSLLVNFGARSCETLGRELLLHLLQDWPGVTSVRVSEDGECAAIVKRAWEVREEGHR